MYFDVTYIILVLPAVIFAMIASAKVNSAMKKYSRVQNRRGLTGSETARRILDSHGLYNVNVEMCSGNTGDHYDPRSNTIRLTSGVYSGASVTAVGVAAHEAGHAVQHAEGYTPIKIRSAIIPATNIGSKMAVPLVIIGLLLTRLSDAFLIVSYIGILGFALSTIFQLITLPVEYNASHRAMKIIKENNMLYDEELGGAKKVLNAAAMTYVAALAVSLMQLLRLMLAVSGGRRRD